ncbi:unnamed protein product [Tetraodon nigroviridis]|uniref:(spotted green pufferfish) hypothetical protein n=1 Tax=Tetraodon nigroviridis TaxID=99883 RepID=Q4T2R3_TETNG|nr:unnamed protein product [Tetraodon nigroviridis]
MLDGTDPLSMFAAASASEAPGLAQSASTGVGANRSVHEIIFQDLGRRRRDKEEELLGPDFEPWSCKRGEILARFTTTEKLSIVSLLRQKCFVNITVL